MNYKFECRCGKKLLAEKNELGEEIRCPACNARILLPFKDAGQPLYVSREPLARPALILSLTPLGLIVYGAAETLFLGPESAFGIVFNIIGALLWLGQVVSVVLGSVALRRIGKAEISGNYLEGEREATAAVVLGSVWLALFVRFMVFRYAGF